MAHLFHHADQHRHAQVFKRSAVAVAALLNPQILQPPLVAQLLGPEQVASPFVGGHDIVIENIRTDEFLFPPDAGPVRPKSAHEAAVEYVFPFLRRRHSQRLDIVDDFEQIVAFRALINYFVERMISRTAVDAAKHSSILGRTRGFQWKCHIRVLE